jgi:phage gp45-like
LPGAEGILLREGGVIYMIASDDRRYRVAIENGEVCIYTDEGDKIHLHRNRIIEIVGGAQVLISTTVATVNASTSATVTSPAINLGGERGGMRKLIDERLKAVFDAHVHTGVQSGGGSSGAPAAALDLGNVATDVTRSI